MYTAPSADLRGRLAGETAQHTEPIVDGDEDAVETDDEDGPVGLDEDDDEAEVDDEDATIPAAAKELKGQKFEDEGTVWQVLNVGYDYFDTDFVSADDVTLGDCECSGWTEVQKMIDGVSNDEDSST